MKESKANNNKPTATHKQNYTNLIKKILFM